jgi:hypothetical protein
LTVKPERRPTPHHRTFDGKTLKDDRLRTIATFDGKTLKDDRLRTIATVNGNVSIVVLAFAARLFRAKSLSQQRLILYPKDIISVYKSLHRLIFSH